MSPLPYHSYKSDVVVQAALISFTSIQSQKYEKTVFVLLFHSALIRRARDYVKSKIISDTYDDPVLSSQ